MIGSVAAISLLFNFRLLLEYKPFWIPVPHKSTEVTCARVIKRNFDLQNCVFLLSPSGNKNERQHSFHESEWLPLHRHPPFFVSFHYLSIIHALVICVSSLLFPECYLNVWCCVVRLTNTIHHPLPILGLVLCKPCFP